MSLLCGKHDCLLNDPTSHCDPAIDMPHPCVLFIWLFLMIVCILHIRNPLVVWQSEQKKMSLPLHQVPQHPYNWRTLESPFPSYIIPVVPPETETSKLRTIHCIISTNDLATFITEMADFPFTYKAFKRDIATEMFAPKLSKKDYILHFRPGLRAFANDIISHRPRMQARLEVDTLSFVSLCREKSTSETQPLPHAQDIRLKLQDIATALERTRRSMNQCGDYISLCDRISAELALDSMLDEDFADDKLDETDPEDEEDGDEAYFLGESDDSSYSPPPPGLPRVEELLARARGQLALAEDEGASRGEDEHDDDQSMSISETSSEEDEVMQDGVGP